jgi:glycosyltransferase involved in cell wall biosynthesis
MLKNFVEKLHPKLKSSSKLYWLFREWYVKTLVTFKRLFDRPKKKKPRVLFFYVYGLAYGGTSSMMQIFAKHLNKDKYDAFLMYSKQVDTSTGMSLPTDTRLQYILDGKVFPIPFDYESVGKTHPYYIKGMSPNFFKILKDFDIDLLVAAGAGHAEFPFSVVSNIPIMILNVFGMPNLQKNVTYHLCISQEVADKLSPIVPREKVKVTYVPTDGPLEMREQGMAIRRSLNIKNEEIVFGRIGRNTDGIFDPIGILAFEKVVAKFPNIHYLIVGAAPALTKIINKHKIPNVHFLPEIGTKEDLWAFYYALDVYAHFRHDGESFGLNLVEAMYAGLPVVSHRSSIWNAHLEYLDPSFSFVADLDNLDQYTQALEFFAKDKHKSQIKFMGEKAKTAAEKFHIKNHIGDFEKMVEDSLAKF